MTPTEWLALPSQTLWDWKTAVQFLRETNLVPGATQRLLNNWTRDKDKNKRLKNFGARNHPLYSKGQLLNVLHHRTQLPAFDRTEDGGFVINMDDRRVA